MPSFTGSFKGTAMGLMLIYVSIVVMLLTMIGMLAASFVRLPPAAVWAILIGLVAVPIFALAGRLMCLSVPAETGAHSLIFPAVALDLGALAIRGIDYFQLFGGAGALSKLESPMALASSIFFLLFLRRLANFLESDVLFKRANDLIKTGVVIALIFVVALGWAFLQSRQAERQDAGMLGMVMGFVMLGASMALLFWFLSYVRLLTGVRKEASAAG